MFAIRLHKIDFCYNKITKNNKIFPKYYNEITKMKEGLQI